MVRVEVTQKCNVELRESISHDNLADLKKFDVTNLRAMQSID